MKKAAEILARLLDKGPAGGGAGGYAPAFHSLFGGWQEIAGPSLAEHCRAYEVRHHSLLVEADHPGWMQLLLMQKKAILARVRQRFPELELRDIKVRVNAAGAAGAGGRKPAIAARQAASAAQQPVTAAEPADSAPPSPATEQALAAVGDPELREKLRLLLQELERRIDTREDK
jgi:hypothetical protein